ncbi:hypothetical protein B0T14DRAFT_254460 [Immersiella caudata]|uniref:Uncharacterized protein n=1 Tax=Immersiella caudata TaxID=314043 RepID=A0AA39WK90_9PEZI|nr:hypothetical protein B0T14DRAFT_254460 [Immersiella caudata]
MIIGPKPDEDYRHRHDEGIRVKGYTHQWADALRAVRRLVANPNPDQTYAVRELELANFGYRRGERKMAKIQTDLDKEETLAAFVKALPNLRQVRLSNAGPPFEAFLQALNEHPNKPDVHLLGETGLRLVSGPLPCVATIRARVNPYTDKPEKANTRMTDLQKLFLSCTNLRSFALTVSGNYGGCMRPHIHHTVTENFQFDGGKVTFPPLESLSLNGYHPAEDEGEWPYWRDGMQWGRLKSLSLGPHPIGHGESGTSLLQHFQGLATSLRSLTVVCWASEGSEKPAVLRRFLESFDTLVEITVKRHFVPARSLITHKKLRKLILHCIEVERPEGESRPTLDVDDLVLLDNSCTELEELEIDISRDTSGQWPKPILETLAASFPNLRRLTLHCEVGIDFSGGFYGAPERPEGPLLPILDETVVRTFAEPFFALRGPSKLENLTLKTGENLRRFPQWPPTYSYQERGWERVRHVYPSGRDGEVKVERGESASWYQYSDWFDSD